MPDRADRVNDMPRLQLVTLCDLRLARFAAVQRHALHHQLWPCCPVNGPVHATSSHEGGVGSVHDGIDIHLGDIALEGLELGGHD